MKLTVETPPDAVPDAGPFEGDALPVNKTLRRVTVIFRLLGWAWMTLLVVTTVATDEGADPAVAFTALGIATSWTAVTVWAARSHETLSRTGFVVADGVIAAGILTTSTIAGAEHFFHGGYPMSWLGVAAYAWGLRGAVPGSFVLVVEQALVDIIDDRNEAVPIAGSVTFLVFAVVAGWGYSAIRDGDRARMRTEAALAAEQERLIVEQEETARLEERIDLANRLHDSVLQTNIAILQHAGDEDQVQYLARKIVFELRETIDAYRSPYNNSVRAALRRLAGEIEDLHRIAVDHDVDGDAEMTEMFETVITAAREALQNAAKHSGARRIHLTALVTEEGAEVYVKDNGQGFTEDPEASGGLRNSLRNPVSELGGRVTVKTAPGEGTEVVIVVGADA